MNMKQIVLKSSIVRTTTKTRDKLFNGRKYSKSHIKYKIEGWRCIKNISRPGDVDYVGRLILWEFLDKIKTEILGISILLVKYRYQWEIKETKREKSKGKSDKDQFPNRKWKVETRAQASS